MTDQIAFIGVGNMGNPMADQLVKAGKKVKVYDVSPEMIKKAKDANLDVVDTLDEVLEGANFVISMLPEGKHVKSLFLGDKGIIDKISKDALIIDCSTIDIETSLLLGKEAKNRGIKIIARSERKMQVRGKYPNMSNRIRVIMNPGIERGDIPEDAMPFGFRGFGALKTNDTLTAKDPKQRDFIYRNLLGLQSKIENTSLDLGLGLRTWHLGLGFKIRIQDLGLEFKT